MQQADQAEHRMSIETSLTKEERCEGINFTTEVLPDSHGMKNKPRNVLSMICEMTLTASWSFVDQSHSLLHRSSIDCF